MKRKLLIGFTVLYILCEIIYNLGLVEFLTSKNTEISVFENLENFGKALSSIGLSLVLIKLVRSSKGKIATFVCLVPLLYLSETWGFDRFIEGLPKETKVAGYYSAVYRNAVINGQIKDVRFSDLNPYNKVVLSNIMSLVDKSHIESAVTDLLKQSADPKVISELYSNYSNLTNAIEPYYSNYAIESKRWAGWKDLAKKEIDKEFVRRTGLPQGLNKEQFFQAVSAQSPSFKSYQESIIVPGDSKLGITELKGKDLPLGLGKVQFQEFVNHKFSEIVAKSKIGVDNIENLPHSFDLISSVFIPPLAILLSLMSIILNLGILLAELNTKPIAKAVLAALPALLAMLVFSTYTNNPYRLADSVNRLTGVEATLFQALNPVAGLIHTLAINDRNPNEAQVIRIKKPERISFKDLEEKMILLKQSSSQSLPKIDGQITADQEKLSTDPGYFGELKSSVNPYTGK